MNRPSFPRGRESSIVELVLAPAQTDVASFPPMRESSVVELVVAPAQNDIASFPRTRESSVVELAPAQTDVASFPRTRESSVVELVLAPAQAGAQVVFTLRDAAPSLAVFLVVLLLASLLAIPASARTLAEVRARGTMSMCANPDALPYSSEKADPPGFQIEIGRALAKALGLPLEIDWIIPRVRASLVNCDMLLDTIAAPDVDRGPIKLSHPYQKSGVALALRAGNEAVHSFADLTPGQQRVGVMVNSVASVIVGRRGIRTVPYSFESDMVADLAHGDIDAAAVSPATIAYYIHGHPDARLSYVNAYDSEPELRWNLAVGLRRSDDALVDAVNTALDQLVGDGTVERIYARYGVPYRHP
jgi:ABC-type amino acid transport substrate-binding protein